MSRGFSKMPFHLSPDEKSVFVRILKFWHPKKKKHKCSGWFLGVCRNTKDFLLLVGFGYRVIESAHISICLPRISRWWTENYWLENEHNEIDRLLHLLAVTFLSFLPPSFDCVVFFSPCDFFSPAWHWWDETQIHCQNKQEIYQSPEMAWRYLLPAMLHGGDKCEIR